ncbi:MAG TPA: hypothetical protein VHP56_06360 [Solirubrobacterales bacterium]|jgi:hypothetical protein|nr:hypothetical protein [Solirubrobacterales bacterium]
MAVMMSPREKWTDERLDDLNSKVDVGFARMDTDLRELRSEMNSRFDAMNRNFLAGLIAVIAAVIGSNAF